MSIDHHTINTLRALADQCADDDYTSAGVKPNVLLALLDAFEERDALAAHVERLTTVTERISSVPPEYLDHLASDAAFVLRSKPESSLARHDARIVADALSKLIGVVRCSGNHYLIATVETNIEHLYQRAEGHQ